MVESKRKYDLPTVFLAILTLIGTSGVPWAYSMHGRVTGIETKLDDLKVPPDWFQRQVESLESRIEALEAMPR